VAGDLARAMLDASPNVRRYLADPETAVVVTDHLAAFLDGVGRGWDGVDQPAWALGNDDAVQVRQLGISCDLAAALWADRDALARLVGAEELDERVIVRVGRFLGGVVTGMRVAEALRREDAGEGGGAR
jgi:hypothetical protein